ncbi:WD domain-containing protein, G-beta repeat-containing protein [Algoriphagus alkaliphilus]|uniref:WD domain-containing protein, G-beta repeat-containing protein n=1 Tax=Algoriphagus alkaliphilus TaxID=279824 RepID=A0A1G5ZIU6_9BACT|nr:WD40 repeat domain-containing protein [Algoriphagus alkaliphilus]SDA94525.1 WD domain-containing protein, G-beta repeat-containing protein [Algoriphagus alkaliphilus]
MLKIQVNKLHTLTGHNDCVYALTEGSDPRFFYTGAGDGMVVEWDLDLPKDGKLIAKLPHSIYALEVDRERNLLIVGHNFEGIHVIDLNENKEIWSLKLTDQAIFDIKVFGNEIFVGTGDGLLIVVDIEERSFKKHIKLSSKSIRVMSIAPVKRQLAIGLSDHSIKILDLANNFQPIANLVGHTNSVFALSYSPDEENLVSGGRDAHMKFWNSDNYTLSENIVAHMYAINYLSFKEDGKFLVTCSMDKSIKVWDAENYKLMKVIDKARNAGHGTSINKVIWSTYSGQVISISDDRTISIWQIEAENL